MTSLFFHSNPSNWRFRLTLDPQPGLTYLTLQLLPFALVATWKNSKLTP